ncbi:energy transducer TonB [Hymenobacter sp. B81]|uniref:energy transducer TonB n=1 Tax=Hymenobacter sp. B81 TaxID=3344878 RepID=UPI0037DCC24D
MIRLFSACVLSGLLLLGAPTAQAQQKLKYPKTTAADIYDAVEQPAQPLGGVEAYSNYLADKLNYPTAALQAGVEGTVEVSFVVEKTGATSNWAVAKPLSPECDAEALRLIKVGPRWQPAQHRGGVVRQRVTVPISFRRPAGGDEAAGSAPVAGVQATASTPAPAAGGPQVVTPEQPARPVGGVEKFFEWVQQNQHYPALARQRKIQGKVMMEFMIEKDGSLTNIKPVKRLGSGLDEEAIRLIKASPKWEPARYQGQPVRQKMVLPILFQL